ncbi:flagellar protein FliT [Lysobacter olei]
MNIPELPAEAVRAAIAKSDWEAASALLAAYDDAVKQRMDDGPMDAQMLAQWQSLLVQQLELLAELQAARDETGRRLRELSQQRRGMNAYLSGTLG